MTTRRQANPRPATLPRTSDRFQFPREVVSELKKVVWPTREEAMRLTFMVVVVSGALGIILGIIDILFSVLVRSVLIG